MLLLFDIDGTLVTSGGAGRRSLARAFLDVTGVDGAMEGVHLGGSTDPTIIADAFALNVGRPPRGLEEIDAIMDRYLVHLEAELARTRDQYRVLPGAADVVAGAAGSGRHAVGLATGNVEAGARLKLMPGGLWERFKFGGYGSDSASRPELVRHGILRGQTYAESRLGRRFELEDVVVIGDTERDVEAARAAGVRVVGVLAGSLDPDALAGAQPDLLVDSLAEEAFWRLIGL